MATTTPNFGWPVPTSTDLVKDGATAMEALGDAIDTSMVDLKGGTTGQILSKASGTDMDFSWTTPNPGDITGVTAGTGISGGGTSGDVTVTNSMATTITTKGDLVPGTGSGTFARLAAGNNGETLVADSSTSTGLRYQGNFAAGKNSVLNSDYSTWQRGTSFTSVANVGYSADRWCIFTGSVSGRDVSRQATNDTTNLPFIKYAARVGRASGNTNTTNFFIGQSYESINSTQLAGKTVTISYYARAGANYSSASNVLNVYAGWGTGTDQNIFAGFTGQTSLGVSNGTLTTTWQRFTTTGTLGATATQFGLYFGYTPSGTAGAADYFEITGVQVEIGSVATAFQTATGTIQGELAACQRYYFRQTNTDNAYGNVLQGFAASTTEIRFVMRFPVQLRATPTVFEWVGMRVTDYTNNFTVSAMGTGSQTPYSLQLEATVSGVTQFRPYTLQGNNSTTSYVGFGAEL